jgi:hypothetical protein
MFKDRGYLKGPFIRIISNISAASDNGVVKNLLDLNLLDKLCDYALNGNL